MNRPELSRAAPWWGLALGLGLVAACAAPPDTAPPPPAPVPARPRGLVALPPEALPGLRVIALMAQDAPDADALRERLSAVARVPVRVLHPLTPRRWALQLSCDIAAACAAAMERLAAERNLVLALEPDPQVPLPPRPSGAMAR